jgi:hypothetical protein
MESNSAINRIHCSKEGAKLLKEQAPGLPLTSRGRIPIKGKGKMLTFWVNERGNFRSSAALNRADSSDKLESVPRDEGMIALDEESGEMTADDLLKSVGGIYETEKNINDNPDAESPFSDVEAQTSPDPIPKAVAAQVSETAPIVSPLKVIGEDQDGGEDESQMKRNLVEMLGYWVVELGDRQVHGVMILAGTHGIILCQIQKWPGRVGISENGV